MDRCRWTGCETVLEPSGAAPRKYCDKHREQLYYLHGDVKQRTVYIDDHLYEWLRQQAKAASCTISQALRDTIKLAKDVVEEDVAKMRQPAEGEQR